MPDVITISEELMSCTDIIAAAIIRQTCPVKDELSERQAQKMFGSRWLMARKDDGSADYTLRPASLRNCRSRPQYSVACRPHVEP